MITKNIKKKIFAAIAMLLCFSLCGCSVGEVSIEDLMRAPQLTESRQQVQNTIDKLLGSSCELIAPSSGDYRNDINLADLDSDGQTEAICLYTDTSTQVIHLLLLQKAEDTWDALGSFTSDATSVDKIEFCDMNGDGVDELIIGWNYLTGSDHYLEILQTGNKTLTSLYKGRYNQYVLVEDGPRIITLDLAGASATLLGYRNYRMASLSSVPIDQRITSFVQLLVSQTNDGPAIYIDAQLEDQTYHTEILVVNSKDYLENKLFTGEGNSADRPLSLRCADIDSDGAIEVPRCAAMEEAQGACYFTYWCKFEDGELKDPLTTFTATADRFYFIYPEEWIDKVLVRQDSKLQRLYHFVNQNYETIYSLRVFTSIEFSQVHPDENWITIIQSEDTVIAYRKGGANDVTFTTAEWTQALNIY